MKWASATSRHATTDAAFEAAAAGICGHVDPDEADLLVVFASHHHASHYQVLHERLRERFPGAFLFGCSARSVIGAGHELEEECGLALTAARLPGVSLHGFRDVEAPLPAVDAESAAWCAHLGLPDDAAGRQARHFLLLSEPFARRPEPLLAGLDRAFPAAQKLGGIASAGSTPGEDVLFLGDEIVRDGLVGLALSGDLSLTSVVAQGCRPIGNPMFVTRCRANELIEVDGRPPIEALQALYSKADDRERELFQSSLFLGIEMRSTQTEYHQGDFLIRNLMGADPDKGSIHIAAELAETQVVQFHLRDARTADQDLADRLRAVGDTGARPRGALLFSCLGRGRGLYGRPDHDVSLFSRHLGDVPLTGFFCNGEVGPVQGRTFLHGYTSAFGLFGPASDDAD